MHKSRDTIMDYYGVDYGGAMYREIIKELEKWKDKAHRKPLLITGVRQCGKTYIVNEFAQKYFKSYIYVNFESEEKRTYKRKDHREL